jgi:hypothetical protein
MTHGGVEGVTNELIGIIRPEVQALEHITTSKLQELKSSQSTPWPQSGGYLTFVTDDRVESYFRIYIGQSNTLGRRILRGHAQKILQCAYSTLQYFLLWLGNGHRSSNFVLLWTMPTQPEDSWFAMRCNLLEALFCRIFFTHHGCLLSAGSNQSTTLRGYGLNVVSPLMQGHILSEVQKMRFIGHLARSSDIQIRTYLSFRARVRRRSIPIPFKPFMKEDYKQAFQEAIKNHSNCHQLVEFLAETDQSYQSDDISHNSQWLPVFGNLSAPLAIILGQGWHVGSEINAEPSTETQTSLPWALDKSGFRADNVSVWTYDFQSFSGLTTMNIGPMDSTSLDLHKKILAPSNAIIVLLCGQSIEDAIPTFNTSTHTLQIRGNSYRIFVHDPPEGTGRPRVFIRSPPLPLRDHHVNLKQAARLCEILKFSSLMVRMQAQLYPYFLEASTAISLILRQRAAEKIGAIQMTADTIDPVIRV